MSKQLPIIEDIRTEIAQKHTLKEILLNFKKDGKHRYDNDVEMLQNIICWIYNADLIGRYYSKKEISDALNTIDGKQYFESKKEELLEEMTEFEA
jgi:hypothetical protein